MILIIDGYNLLRAIYPDHKGKSDQQKNYFVRQLGFYKELKAATINEIIIVFDAGPFSHATREVHNGVIVMHSGQGSDADRWIIDYTERRKGKEMLVISRDRQLVDRCRHNGAESLGVEEFYQLMSVALLECSDEDLEYELSSEIHKIQQDDRVSVNWPSDNNRPYGGLSDQALDLLMEEASMGVKPKNETSDENRKGKGNAQSGSKQEKKWIKTFKKLCFLDLLIYIILLYIKILFVKIYSYKFNIF